MLSRHVFRRRINRKIHTDAGKIMSINLTKRLFEYLLGKYISVRQCTTRVHVKTNNEIIDA